jgi:hypothetical protein
MIPLLVLALLLSLVTSSPIETIVPIPICDARVGAPGGVYMCPAANFTATADQPCRWLPPANICYFWASDIAHRPRSVGPDAGGYCEFFTGMDCTGEVKTGDGVMG